MPDETASHPLKRSSQYLITLCVVILCFGADIIYWSPLMVQTLLLSQNFCGSQNASCTKHGLGLSTVEYGLGGFTSAIAALTLCSGVAIDLLGLQVFVFVHVSVLFSASIFISITPYIIDTHVAVVIFYLLSRFCSSCVNQWSCAICQYMSIRYYESKWQAFVISLVSSIGCAGAIMTGLISPRIANLFGIQAVFWGNVSIIMLPVGAAFGLVIIFKCCPDVIAFEEEKRSISTKIKIERPHAAIFFLESMKSFKINYWLITSIIALSSASTFAYMANIPFIHTTLFRISRVAAAQNSAIGWLFAILLVPLLGLFLSRVPIHLFLSFVAISVEFLKYSILLLPYGGPKISSLLSLVPYSTVIMALSPFLSIATPENALGVATTTLQAADSILYGITMFFVGVALDHSSDKVVAAWHAVYLLSALPCCQILLLCVLSIRLKFCRTAEEDEDKRLLDDTILESSCKTEE